MLHGLGHAGAALSKTATALLAIAASGFGWASEQAAQSTGIVDQVIPWTGLGAGLGFFFIAWGVFRFSIRNLRTQIDDLQEDARELRGDLSRIRAERNDLRVERDAAREAADRAAHERDLLRLEVTSLTTRLELIEGGPPTD